MNGLRSTGEKRPSSTPWSGSPGQGLLTCYLREPRCSRENHYGSTVCYRIFEFSGIRPGVRYRASITEGDLEVELFDFTELHAVALDGNDENHLNPPPADPAAPFDPSDDPPDAGVLNVRLFDASGNPMTNALYRLSVAGEALGLSEDGVASIKLPSPCPPTGILEWGEPDDAGVLEFRREIALDCDDDADRTSSMLHNLGYPKSLPLDTRVRSFQSQHPVGETGLDASGGVPSRTRAATISLPSRRRRRLREGGR